MSFSKESDSTVYGVDYNGKVWALGNSNPPAWTRLHNPTNVNIKVNVIKYSLKIRLIKTDGYLLFFFSL